MNIASAGRATSSLRDLGRLRDRCMFVTVIVPVLNAEQFLALCLESLLAQDYPAEAFEVLVVDNGSSDGSVAIARCFERVTLLHEPRRGAYVARNRGLAAARGDICAFTDPDCIAEPTWLRQMAAAMSNPRLGVVCGQRLAPTSSGSMQMINDYETTKDQFVLDGNDTEIHYGYSNNMAVRRQVFERVGLFHERPRGADTLFVRAVSGALGPGAIAYCDTARVMHMEWDSLHVYLKKVFLYARHRRWNNEILCSRPLTTSERLAIFRQTMRRHEYSPLRAATLLLLLASGSLCWVLGDVSARLWRGTSDSQ